jgi:hypothetical protein
MPNDLGLRIALSGIVLIIASIFASLIVLFV